MRILLAMYMDEPGYLPLELLIAVEGMATMINCSKEGGAARYLTV